MSRVMVAVGLLVLSSACASAPSAPAAPQTLRYKRIVLSPESREQPLVSPPESVAMRSGRVVLQAGEDMHRHSTSGNEELLVFLQGSALVQVGDQPVQMGAGQVLYIPPQTEHEVHNAGPGELRYIYTVAPARP